jgi:pyruvate/2-oxoglutarate dehydrogenase complex dihydrolipoamide dehydrogenase (E3) component
VDVHLGVVVTPAVVQASAAEVVIVATGAQPAPLAVPGGDGRIISAWDVLAGKATIGTTVVVMGGGEVGCELAEHLASQGKQVIILEILQELALNMEPRGRVLLVQRLRRLGVQVLMQSRVTQIEGTTVTYEQGGLPYRLTGVETVVSAVGSVAHKVFRESPAPSEVPVHSIGDCVKPRRILEAIREGFEIGYEL